MSEPPVVLRRRLGRELKRLRSDLGLTLEQVSAGAQLAISTLSRYENSQSTPKLHDFGALLTYFQAQYQKAGRTDLTAKRIEELRDVRTRAARRGWWSSTFGVSVPDWYSDYVSLEMSASAVLMFHFGIPGLFQTREHATAVISAGTTENVDRLVAIRESRQKRLGEPGFAVDAVIDEGALHRQVGSKQEMRRQMLRLMDLATQPTITIRVLPYAKGAEASSVGAGFSILQFPDDDAVAYLEHYAVGHYVEGSERVDGYRLAFDRLAGHAFDREQSITALAKASETWA